MSNLSEDASSLTPLTSVLHHGLPAVALFGTLSFVFSTSLLLFLTYRLVSWRRKSGSQEPTNQFFVLIYNLLLADIQQACAFLLNTVALERNAIEVGSSQCWAQGWFVSTGDLASSIFILAIAIHTFMGVVKGYKLPSFQFYTGIACLWAFNYILAIIGVAMHPTDLYTRAGAWCWINSAYQKERLYLHYLWIFICMTSTSMIYAIIYSTLNSRARAAADGSYRTKDGAATPRPAIPHGATPLMLLYPAIYIICTIPVAAGRIASMAGRNVTVEYFCIAGAMIASNGWLDVLLYATTRRGIIFSDDPPSHEIGIETFRGLTPKLPRLGNITTIRGGCDTEAEYVKGKASKGRVSSNTSTDNFYPVLGSGSNAIIAPGFAGIQTETTYHVRSESVTDTYEMETRTGASPDPLEKDCWDTRSVSFDEECESPKAGRVNNGAAKKGVKGFVSWLG